MVKLGKLKRESTIKALIPKIKKSITNLTNQKIVLNKLKDSTTTTKFRSFQQIKDTLNVSSGKRRVINPIKSYNSILDNVTATYPNMKYVNRQKIASDIYRNKDNIKLPNKINKYINDKINSAMTGKRAVFNMELIAKYRTPAEFTKILFDKLKNGKTYHVISGNQTVTVGENLYKDAMDYLYRKYRTRDREADFSDVQFSINYELNKTLVLYEYDPEKVAQKKRQNGGFFPYLNKMKFNLSKYQIFSSYEEMVENRDTGCLVKALMESGKLTMNQVLNIDNDITNSVFPVSSLNELCRKTNITINLSTLRRKGDRYSELTTTYGTGDIKVNIGLLESHYFINDDVNISLYAIRNYSDIKDVVNWNHIYKKDNRGYFKKNSDIKTSAFKVIHELLKHRDALLSDIKNDISLMSTFNYGSIREDLDDNTEDLEYIEATIKLIKQNERKQPDIAPVNIFFDFECEPFGVHKAFYICWRYENNLTIKNKAAGPRCAVALLRHLHKSGHKHFNLYAHYAKYDYRFIHKYLNMIKENENDGCFKYAMGTYKTHKEAKYSIKIHIYDTYNFIPKPLREFPSMFGLGAKKKEIVPYKLYNSKLHNFYQPLDKNVVYKYLHEQIALNEPIYKHTSKEQKLVIMERRKQLLNLGVFNL
jgi:hypothetical protein